MKDAKDNLTKQYSLATAISGAVAAFLGASAFLGWASDIRLLTGAFGSEIPMAPNTALKFILLGTCLAAFSLRPSNRLIIWFARAVVVVVAILSVLTLIQFLIGVNWGIDSLIFHTERQTGEISEGRTSPLTALCFLAAAASFSISLLPDKIRWWKNLAAIMAVAVLFLGLVFSVGYLYGTPMLYGGTFVPLAMPTAAAFIFLGLGLLLAEGRESWPLKLFSGDFLRAQLLRVFLPLAAIVVIGEGWIMSAVIRNQSDFNPALLSSLTAVFILAGVGVAIAWLAKDIGGSVDRAHAERLLAEENLRKANAYNRSLIEVSLDPLVTIDATGKITDVNAATEKVTGHSRSELIGTDFSDYFTEPDKARAGYQRAFHKGTVRDYSLKIRHRDARITSVLYNASTYLDESGRVAGVLAAARDVTDRHRAEEELRRREQELNESQRIAHIGSWDWDSAADTIWWSDEYYRIYGIDPDLPTPKYHEHLKVYTPESRERLDQAVQRAMQTGEPYELDLELLEPRADTRWITARGEVKRNSGGKIIGLRGTAQNITERKMTEEALQRSNRALKVLSECNQVLVRSQDESRLLKQVCDILVDVGGYRFAWVGIARKDEQRTVDPVAHAGYEAGYLENASITWADNERGRGPTGRAIRERRPVVGRDIARNQGFEPWRADALERGYRSSIALPLVTDGEVIGSLQVYSGEPEAFNDDEVRLLVEMTNDIAYGVKSLRLGKHHELAEKALIDSEAKYRNLFEESKDAVFICTPEGRITDLNPAGIELFGFRSKEELQKVEADSQAYVSSESWADFRKTIEEKGFVKDYELRLQNRQGKELIVLASATTAGSNGGNSVFFTGILHDMTERLRLEEQLYRAQRLESVGRLAGGIAHDFNNFLTAVKGYIDLALTELPKDSPAGEDLVEAGRSAERAAGLTRQLLIFSRRESMNLKPLDLNITVKEMLKMLDQIIGERYQIVTVLDDSLGRINADAGHIEQVIMNLVVNARDAMEATGGRIYISTENTVIGEEYAESKDAAPGNYVVLTVRDTGYGMDEEARLHIFEPFFSKKPGMESTGLGLSLVYGITKQHGGWIDVESAPDKGATFRIFFPEVSSKTSVPAGGEEITGDLRGNGERLLIVEDEEQVRKFIVTLLERNGYEVTEAATAEEALERFNKEKGHFDLVCSDVVLPGEDGVWLAERLSGQNPEIPILLASGYNHPAEQRAISEDGLNFISKPYSRNDLLARIKELITKD